MTIKPPPDFKQLNLFDQAPEGDFKSPASARTHYGRCVEQIVVSLLDLIDITNSGSHEIVMDAAKDDLFYEIKSVFRTSAIPLYEWRRSKDRALGRDLIYAVALHRCQKAGSYERMWDLMSETLTELLLIPAATLNWMAPKYSLKQLVEKVPGSRVGYEREGYCEGYRNIPVRDILNLPFGKSVQCETSLFDRTFVVNVRCYKRTPLKAVQNVRDREMSLL